MPQTQSQTLLTLENALKANYLPAWENMLSTEPSAFLSRVKKVPLTNNEVIATAPVGLSGGFGFGQEGQATPQAGGVKYERFKTSSKDMYVNICISQKAVKLATSGGAMVNALDAEIQGAYATAKWNMGRALLGNGTGVLTTISALGSAGNTVQVADTSKLMEGLIVDFYADSTDVPEVAARRITSVDRANKTVTFSGAPTTLSAGFVTVQNSYGRELTGIGAIFDTTNVTELYGRARGTDAFMNPVVRDANKDISDTVITQALREASKIKNSNVDMILCGDDAFDAYVAYLRTTNTRVEEVSRTLDGGFKAIRFIFGNKEVDIVNEQFVPTNEMWGVDTSKLELHTQEWSFCDLQGGGIFNLMENQSVYRALLANYGELICTNPGGCVRIYNVVA